MKIKRQAVLIPYYDDKSRLNHSLIKIFRESPMAYKRELDNPRELNMSFLKEGTMIHKYILEHADFFSEYYLQYAESPNKSPNQRKLAERLIQENFSGEVDLLTTIYKECYNTSKLSPKEVEVKAIEAANEIAEYVKENMLHSSSMLPVDQKTLETLKRYTQSIHDHTAARDLLDEDFSHPWFSEFHINWVHPSGAECKSLIDRIKFIPETKTVWVIDLKSTSDVANFRDSADKYGHITQIAFYRMAVVWYIEHILKENPLDWTINTAIIAIEKQTADVKVFSIDEYELDDATLRLNGWIEDIQWHKQNNIWNMDREAFDNNGINLLK
ncbi:hypothetical protein AGMMS50239_39760 [Bacteroidia bacterium]|nr:hypothetical protein AGMMS50239_39760 [Bacteroidia bacterium]